MFSCAGAGTASLFVWSNTWKIIATAFFRALNFCTSKDQRRLNFSLYPKFLFCTKAHSTRHAHAWVHNQTHEKFMINTSFSIWKAGRLKRSLCRCNAMSAWISRGNSFIIYISENKRNELIRNALTFIWSVALGQSNGQEGLCFQIKQSSSHVTVCYRNSRFYTKINGTL